jgi:hypothetical protein
MKEKVERKRNIRRKRNISRADNTHPNGTHQNAVNPIASSKEILIVNSEKVKLSNDVSCVGAVRPANRRNGWHPESK